MHISDGILTLEVTIVSTVVAFGFLFYSFKNLSNDKIALASAFSALFFVASFIHIPFGPTQIHLMLLGFIGIFLGSISIFSISLALILQALLLGFGGVSSIGANILIMGVSSYLVFLLFNLRILQKLNEKIKFFLVGFSGILISSIILFFLLIFSKNEYENVAYSIFVINIPTMILEGLVTLFLFLYIKKAMPNLLKELNI
ncbi:CbiM family transporter [Aliarcobacter cibarius]|uniref:Cobalamin biosynthesis protein n=1 Tax=Aliarcobacter cibarius TaxID=255507 RepID=A0A7L5JPH1_9BACT|nr:CbiM family transporter [Aliarcobacter cibarius]QKJ27154.1 cobalt/nickel ECF transporter CbiMNQO, S component CbiM [Aliarcobacter cibarius]TLS96650.1 cobalamin biosynthesis protein [Aliarcobacter cibarius]TLS97237.1 cobalamin biosynthesis protein [Aliarcobacter cibarius]TLT02588.1 cobalamin biosynthesis protein [Aliarcobacter cibarius]